MATKMRFEARDANLLLPIMKYPGSYNIWCTSKGYVAGGPKTFQEFTTLLRQSADVFSKHIPDQQEHHILDWSRIYIQAYERWRPAEDFRPNYLFFAEVFRALERFSLQEGEEKELVTEVYGLPDAMVRQNTYEIKLSAENHLSCELKMSRLTR